VVVGDDTSAERAVEQDGASGPTRERTRLTVSGRVGPQLVITLSSLSKERRMGVQRAADLDLERLRNRDFFPSPAAWEDQVLYFLMLDRFSDGREDGVRSNDGDLVDGTTPRFRAEDEGNAVATEADAARWREAGSGFVGGTLKGLTSKMGYLQRLGVSAVWVSPVFKQVPRERSYHGYGVQDFLEVDSRFGTVDELAEMVAVAHGHGIRVILDIILNHTGDVFAYDPDRYWTDDGSGGRFLDPRWDGRPYAVAGFRDERGNPTLPFAPVDLDGARAPSADAGVWPAELYDPRAFSRMGRINSWDHDPEFLQGDFATLKNVHLGLGGMDDFQPSPALLALTRVYQYWIARLDLDGFRVDTVKHMDLGATRFFASAIHEFAESLGKEDFYLIGEITGGRRRAYETLETTGLDAALGIDDIPDKLEYLVKGWRNPAEYFELFRNSLLVRKDSHVWFKDRVVTVFDDHDQVRKGHDKARFCADADGRKLALAVLALNATTLGIPCIYYGSEQRLDGAGGDDRYIREAMFGGEFGPFRSRGRHLFDEDGPVYRELAKVLALRRENIALRRGRQYLRDISGDGRTFGPPRLLGGRMRSVVPWSRIFVDREVLCAINTDADAASTAWVTIDDALHAEGESLQCRYSTDPGQVGSLVTVEARNGKAVLVSVPAAGFVIYA
jgi:glycosidase